jgi:hypothetical protein
MGIGDGDRSKVVSIGTGSEDVNEDDEEKSLIQETIGKPAVRISHC